MNIEFEQAVRLLSTYLPVSNENTRKPVLFHDIRVGVYLYEHGYSREIVLAGVLHDTLEFSTISQKVLKDEFGEAVLRLVLACTKDDSITDPQKKTTELIQRCVRRGQEALIVKVADILDSYKFYTRTKNQEQIEYCKRNAFAICRYKPIDYKDKIFEELIKFLKDGNQ